MSTDYIALKPILACELFDGRLEKFGVREHIKPIDEDGFGTTEHFRCLTDSRNFVWVSIGDDGIVKCFSRFAFNVESKILNAVFRAFDVDIVSEHEPQFWGFETEEEWHKAHDEIARKHGSEQEEHALVELVKYLRGEPHDFKRGTNGMEWAKYVKKFVKKDPTLLAPENKEKLRKLYQEAKWTTNMVVTLSPEDLACVQMLATHEDDLPQA